MKNINLEGAAGAPWDNTSEVTTLTSGVGISITDDGTGKPIITNTVSNAKNVVYILNSSSWTVPVGISQVKLTLIGGGAAGSSTTTTNGAAGSGGAGGTTIVTIKNLVGGTSALTFVVGATSTGAGNITTATLTGPVSGVFKANGGSQGTNNNLVTPGGLGGAVVINPGYAFIQSYLAIEGGTAGYAVNLTGIPYWIISNGGNSTLGGGAPTLISTGSNGNSGLNATGGGGGGGVGNSKVFTGGTGGSGIIIIEY